jgi:hypothetical protein
VSRRRPPEDRLRDANPVSLEDVPTGTDPHARDTFERIVRSAPTPRVGGWRSRRRLVLVLVPIVLAAGIGAGYVWLKPATQPLVVVCYARPSLGAERAAVPAGERGDVAACAPLWRDHGQFSAASRGAVPGLVACLLPSGAVGVFPSTAGQDPCLLLNLPHAATNSDKDENAAIVRVQNAVVPLFVDHCVGEAAALRAVRAQLDRNGLDDWGVVATAPFTSAQPCASLALDAAHRTIDLVPVRNPATP